MTPPPFPVALMVWQRLATAGLPAGVCPVPYDTRFDYPTPPGRPASPATPLSMALAFLCAPVLLGLCGYGYLQATGQTVRFAPGGMPQLVAAGQAQAPPPTAMPAAAPASPPPPIVVRPTTGGQAVSRRSANGHFFFETGVNGATVPMVFDTGASVTTLRHEDAAKAGVDMGALNYTVRMRTANGITEAAYVTLRTFRVGTILQTDVPAIVMPRGKVPISLLGQSFSAKLASFRFDGDQLVLQAR